MLRSTLTLGSLLIVNNLSEIAQAGAAAQAAARTNLGVTGSADPVFTGQLFLDNGTAALPSLTFTSDPDTGLYRSGANQLAFTVNAIRRAQVDTSGFNIYSSTNLLGGTIDGNAAGGALSITGTVLLGTTTDSANGRLQLASHTTSAGGIGFGTDVTLYRSAADKLKTDDEFIAPSLLINDYVQCTRVLFTNSTRVQAPNDGNLLLMDSASATFGRVMFGGTTNSFPAIKRSGNLFQLRLADDSDFCSITAKTLLLTGAAPAAGAGEISLGATTAATVGAAGAAAALPAQPLGYLIGNVAGTAVKIPYYNN